MRGAVAAAFAAVALAGCLDSVVGGRCAEGWVADGDSCRLANRVDAGAPDLTDAAVDGSASTCDLCPSGICGDGGCVGAAAGQVVLIGHDYRVHHPAAARLLGNAVALGAGATLRVAWLSDETDLVTVAAVQRALTAGLAASGRTWSPATLGAAGGGLGAVDVVLVLPRGTTAAASSAAGLSWQAALAAFVSGGGTVVGLEGSESSTADFLRAANLLEATRAAHATGAEVILTTPTDALAVGVATPYRAELGSTTFVTSGDAVVVASAGGEAIVLHRAATR